jgi:hypothetical protein
MAQALHSSLNDRLALRGVTPCEEQGPYHLPGGRRRTSKSKGYIQLVSALPPISKLGSK